MTWLGSYRLALGRPKGSAPATALALRGRALRGAMLLGLVVLAFCGPVKAQSISESAMKASYVYNFIRYANWPPALESRAGGNVMLCVLGSDAVTTELQKLHGRATSPPGKVQVVNLNSLKGVRDCHALFISERELDNIGIINRSIGDAPVLTVADSPTANDVAINMVLENDRVLFDVNIALVKMGGLTLSSKVLRLARAVRGA
jgi:hypothetical protein